MTFMHRLQCIGTRQIPILVVALLTTATSAAAQSAATAEAERHPDSATSHRSFADVERWQPVFDNPARAEWQKPEKVVAALGLLPGMTVADLGAGTGYFELLLSKAVGPGGTVLAAEPEPNMVAHLRKRAEEEDTDNVVPILASFDNPRLPTAAVDLVMIVDSYHHIDHRLSYLPKLRRVLRPSGRVAIIDWYKRPLPEGPPPEHKLARAHVVEEMTAAGFELIDSPDFLPYQYFLIFRARAEISSHFRIPFSARTLGTKEA